MSKVSAVAVLYHRYGGRRVWGEGRGRVRGGGGRVMVMFLHTMVSRRDHSA